MKRDRQGKEIRKKVFANQVDITKLKIPDYQDSLACLFPDLAKQWHQRLNGNLKPEHITKGSNTYVYWKCDETTCDEKCEHVWPATVSDRTRGRKCPFCSTPRRQFCKHNSLEAEHPMIAIQWHPDKNGKLTPRDVSPQSHKKIWWFCPETNCDEKCEHIWPAEIKSRAKLGHGCPFCSDPPQQFCEHNSLEAKYPMIAKQWHPDKNGNLTPKHVSPHSNKEIWWFCEKNNKHEWNTRVDKRTRKKEQVVHFVD